MADLKLNSSGGGSVTLTTPSTASNLTLTLPSASGTVATTTGSLSSPTISSPTMTGTVTGGTYASASITAANSNTVEATSGPTSTQLAGMRNKIINGAMMIDQRNAGASVSISATGYTYTLDRWAAYASATSKFSVQQNAGSVTPPAGFSNYVGVTSSSAYSVGATDLFMLTQRIEGFNTADLNLGSANGSSFTLSFWARSSLTGTFSGAVNSNGGTAQYIFSYTISAANTWQYVTVAIPASTSGTWAAGNATSIQLSFNLGSGANNLSTAGSWLYSGSYFGVTGTTSVVGTNGATFYITGVQLEKGATSTPFENRLYGTELALCQRYYENNYSTGYAVGSLSNYPNNPGFFINGFTTTSGQKLNNQPFRVQKRTIPTMTSYDGAGNAGKVTTLVLNGTATHNQSLAVVWASDVLFGFGAADGTHTGLTYFYVASAEL